MNQEALGKKVKKYFRLRSGFRKNYIILSSKFPTLCIWNIEKTECYTAQSCFLIMPMLYTVLNIQLQSWWLCHEDRWVHQALKDHLSGDWPSPYLQYISNLRGLLGIFSPVPAPSQMKDMVGDYFLANLNTSISSLNWVMPVETLSRSSYVCEHPSSSVITQFKLDCAGLGDKQPRMGHTRKPLCPVCPLDVPNTGIHLLFLCLSVSALRRETGIQSFITKKMRAEWPSSGQMLQKLCQWPWFT